MIFLIISTAMLNSHLVMKLFLVVYFLTHSCNEEIFRTLSGFSVRAGTDLEPSSSGCAT